MHRPASSACKHSPLFGGDPFQNIYVINNSTTPCCFQLQAFFLVADDIMDASVTRRGQPCWYKKVTLIPCLTNEIFLGLSVLFYLPCVFAFQDGIGLDAINDSFLLEGSIYRLLRRHCRGQPYYIHLLELFTEVV